MQRSQVIAIYALVGSVLLVASVLALLMVEWSMQGSGSIEGVGLGVYRDPECTQRTSSLDFGLLTPGFSENFTLYVRNEGEEALNLNMTLENWNPTSAADFMILTWNREGLQIGSEEVAEFVITLSVSESIRDVSSFSLDIIISGVS